MNLAENTVERVETVSPPTWLGHKIHGLLALVIPQRNLALE
jgi:hypothetical protein